MPSLKPTVARNGVFISYARSDGEEFANDLRERLEAEGIPLWQDRVGMEGGRDWWLQITEALDQVEFMALVITPNALKSDTVRKEWRYARQQGVCVYPIQGTPDLDFDSLPRWMRTAHFYDLEREWQKFLNDLNTRCQTRRVPFMVEDLPEGFVPRPAEFEQLVKFLVDERREEPVAITAALRGAGGYGKTTLAKALCHDERVQDAFDDGILWVTLGETPGDLTGRVEDLIVTLGDNRPNFTALDAAVNRFKELLADRDILIVIDDVWDRAHLNPFIQGGTRCARLITTRDLATVPMSAAKVRVDAMQQEEATALLTAGLDESLSQGGPVRRELKELASRLGEWPLLLRLVNSALRNSIENDKESLPDALTSIDKALTKRGLTYFDARNSDERNRAVAKTIEVSLALLNGQERDRYEELAIFPEDVDIPLATLEKLWGKTGGFDQFDTKELCSRLNRFSLLWSYDANRQRIRLHDVVRKFLIEQQPGKLPSINAQLLDAHRPASVPHWSDMSAQEPYLWEHLAHHLTEGGRGDELVATVKDSRYLVAKTLIRKTLAVEADLLAAEKVANDDEQLRMLRRNFVNSGHLLNRCNSKSDLKATLLSRLRHLDELNAFTKDLEQNLTRPCLVPISNLPDLPPAALVRTLSGHKGFVFGCAVSLDGSTIVSASDDTTLKVWDRATGAERLTLSGHAGAVKGCAVSADGGTIVSASDDGTVKVWDGRSGTERFTLKGHDGGVTSCGVSADGAVIVSGSSDQTLKVWDGRSGSESFTLKGHDSAVTACGVSADGLIIVSASSDRTLKVWDGRSRSERFTLRGHADAVTSCAISSDQATIVSASNDQTLIVWDATSGKKRCALSGHRRAVKGCAVSADGKTVVSASSDRTIKVWDGRTGTERLTLSGHAYWVSSCAVSGDGLTIISASYDQTIRLWDGRTDAERIPVSGHTHWVNDCAVSADGTSIVSASNDQTLKVWDGSHGTERLTLSGHVAWVNGCAISPDGCTIISASDDRTLKVWDGRSGTERFSLSGHTDWVSDCAVSADGSTIVSASRNGLLKVWDGQSGTERMTLSGHSTGIRDCAFSADGSTIVSASDDHTLRVWDGRTGAERFLLSGHEGSVKSCAVSADGAIIVSGSADHTLKVWDGWRGAELFELHGHAAKVDGCAISADGTTIISVSWDQTLKVWDVRTKECITTLPVDGVLYSCDCSASAEIIAAAGARGVYLLRLLR